MQLKNSGTITISKRDGSQIDSAAYRATLFRGLPSFISLSLKLFLAIGRH